jgi:hypothetical protein
MEWCRAQVIGSYVGFKYYHSVLLLFFFFFLVSLVVEPRVLPSTLLSSIPSPLSLSVLFHLFIVLFLLETESPVQPRLALNLPPARLHLLSAGLRRVPPRSSALRCLWTAQLLGSFCSNLIFIPLH